VLVLPRPALDAARSTIAVLVLASRAVNAARLSGSVLVPSMHACDAASSSLIPACVAAHWYKRARDGTRFSNLAVWTALAVQLLNIVLEIVSRAVDTAELASKRLILAGWALFTAVLSIAVLVLSLRAVVAARPSVCVLVLAS